MKKSLTSLVLVFAFPAMVFAETLYLPSSDSDQYLPTVKILTYSLYDGSLIAQGLGSGTLIDGSGTIITNNHVIQDYYDAAKTYDAFQICLTKSNNTEEPICEFTASLITRDPDRDIALLKMDNEDVRGNSVKFDFYLEPSFKTPEIGTSVTAIGYPDTGGKTITYTSGLVSGFLTEGGVKYIKTDADISFGNSGGTAVDGDGNFIGVPTFIVGSYSAEVLGYLFPISDALDWIETNSDDSPQVNEVANDELRSEIKAYIEANDTGHYVNDYPPYEISLIDGWKFGNSMDGSFRGNSDFDAYTGGDSLSILPEDADDSSFLAISISMTNYSYDVTLDDVEEILDEYYGDYYTEEEFSYERTKFNGYDVVKSQIKYVDWWYYDGATIYTDTYYLPYGSQVINISYSYGDEDTEGVGLEGVDEILGSFEIDMGKIVSSVVDIVESANPEITVRNPLDDAHLADNSYDYGGDHYFGAIFGKKEDHDFYVSIYSSTYWDDKYVGNFDLFKKETLEEVEEWSEIMSRGNITIDGHKGFFYTEKYDYGYSDVTYSTNMYIENGGDSYFTVYYSGTRDSYEANLSDFNLILKNIEFENEGKGTYSLGGFAGLERETLKDIEDYIYEDNIRNLEKAGAFYVTPARFRPAEALSRKDFVVWAVRSLSGDMKAEFEEFQDGYNGCVKDCFEDVDYGLNDGMYIEFARNKGAVGGLSADGKYYFSPEGQVSLMAAFKIIFELNDYEVWKAPSFVPWYIPYLHLGYMNYVMPYGVRDAGYLLNRGEGAFIIDGVNSEGDYYW